MAYARPVYMDEADIESLSKLIAKISAVSVGDVRSVLYTLADLVANELSHGRLVSLGDLGRLRLTLRSKAVKKAEEFKTEMIKRAAVIFTPGKLLREMIQGISFERVNPLGEKTEPAKDPKNPSGEGSEPGGDGHEDSNGL